MEAKYSENQSGLWIILLLLIAGGIPIFGILSNDASQFFHWAMLLTIGIIIICALLFYTFRTVVYRDRIKLSFGIGIISKNIDLKTVKSVEIVRNKWIYGWGIRYIMNGWMWNIYGLDAIELRFRNKDSIFRIGSQNPKKLKEKIEGLINS